MSPWRTRYPLSQCRSGTTTIRWTRCLRRTVRKINTNVTLLCHINLCYMICTCIYIYIYIHIYLYSRRITIQNPCMGFTIMSTTYVSTAHNRYIFSASHVFIVVFQEESWNVGCWNDCQTTLWQIRRQRAFKLFLSREQKNFRSCRP